MSDKYLTQNRKSSISHYEDCECKLIRNMDAMRVFHTKREKEIDFSEWTNHYEEHLKIMYYKYVMMKYGISYDNFTRIAYECTDTIGKKYKNSRPLI